MPKFNEKYPCHSKECVFFHVIDPNIGEFFEPCNICRRSHSDFFQRGERIKDIK